MPDHVVFVTTELQEQRIAQLEAAVRRHNKDIRHLASAGLLLVAMGLILQRQIDILNNQEKKNE